MMLRRCLFSVQLGHVGPAAREKREERGLSFSMREVYGRVRGTSTAGATRLRVRAAV